MRYIYYRCEDKVSNRNIDENLRIEIEHPFWENMHSFVWKLTSFLYGGIYEKWRLFRGNKLLSEAEVVSWTPIFDFMPKDGIHIGPCRTVIDERGKGYYPYLLRKIVTDRPESDYYMIVSESNLSSIKGVLKAGFSPIGEGYKSRFLGRYILKIHQGGRS